MPIREWAFSGLGLLTQIWVMVLMKVTGVCPRKMSYMDYRAHRKQLHMIQCGLLRVWNPTTGRVLRWVTITPRRIPSPCGVVGASPRPTLRTLPSTYGRFASPS